MDDLACLLYHRSLINSYRNCRCAESGDIGCLADRICEESHWNAFLVLSLIILTVRKSSQLHLLLYSRVALQSLDCDKVHVVERQFAKLRYL